MNEREYLDHLGRVKSDAIPATVESRNDDGTYMVRTIGGRALRRASTANPTDTFKLGQRVILSEPSASRSVIGSEAIIQTRAPRDQRGLSDTTPAESIASAGTVFITSIDPDPLVLVAGGEPSEQTIIGRGFIGAALYEAASEELSAPSYTETTAPVVTASKIVMTISAAGDSPTGDFDVIAGTARGRSALRILARPPGIYPPFFVVSGEVELVSEDLLAVLWVLDPATLSEIARLEVAADRSYGLTWIDGLIYWITRTGSDYSLRTFNPATNASTIAPLSSVISAYAAGELAYIDGDLLFASAAEGSEKGLWSFDLDGTGGTHEWVDMVSGSTGRVGIAADADAVYLAGFNGTVRLDRATFAQEASSATPTGTRVIVVRAWTEGSGYGAPTGDICVAGGGDASVRWRSASDLSSVNTFTVSGGNFRGPVQMGDRIYFVNASSGKLHRATLDGSDVDELATVALFLASHGSLNADGESLLYLGSDQTARKMATDGTLLLTSGVLDSVSESAFVDLLQVLYVAG